MAAQRSVVLLSGGLDSAANLALCSDRDAPILALTFDYGQRAARREIGAAAELARYYGVSHRVIEVPWLSELGQSALTKKEIQMPRVAYGELDQMMIIRETARAVWVPNRNGLFIAIGAAYAESLGATQIVVGFNREEASTFPDNSRAFLEEATRGLSYSTATGVRVFSYTVDWDKRTIVESLRGLSRPFPRESVWSCYEGGEKACGRCESCQRSTRAWELAAVR